MAAQKFTVGHEAPLLVYLYEIFSSQSRTSVKNMLSKGQILVNDARVTAFDTPLRTGDVLTVLPKGISIARTMRADAREDGRGGHIQNLPNVCLPELQIDLE